MDNNTVVGLDRCVLSTRFISVWIRTNRSIVDYEADLESKPHHLHSCCQSDNKNQLDCIKAENPAVKLAYLYSSDIRRISLRIYALVQRSSQPFPRTSLNTIISADPKGYFRGKCGIQHHRNPLRMDHLEMKGNYLFFLIT